MNENTEEELALQLQTLLASCRYELSEEDKTFVTKLRPNQMLDLVGRVRALVEIRNGATVEDASRTASVSTPTMYRLNRLWRAEGERTLRTIAGFSARPRGLRHPSQRFEDARKVARRLIGSGSPLKSVHALVEAVRDYTGRTISVTAAERIVRDELAEQRLGRTATNFGLDIVVDSVAVSLVIAKSDEPSAAVSGEPALGVLGLVIESASGIILGASIARGSDAARAQYEAMVEASWFMFEKRVDVLPSTRARLHLTAAPMADPFAAALAKRVKTLFGEDAVKDEGPRRYGRQTVDILGSSLGPLRFLPWSTEAGKPSAAKIRAIGKEPVSLGKAQDIVRTVVEEHNKGLIVRLRGEGVLPPEEVPPFTGQMGLTLDNVLRSDDLKSASRARS